MTEPGAETGTVTMVVKSFPAGLHRQLKMQSAAEDVEMREIVREAVTRELARRQAGNGSPS
jgi:plasmid stability protein